MQPNAKINAQKNYIDISFFAIFTRYIFLNKICINADIPIVIQIFHI